MKKKAIAAVCIVLAVVLLFPVPLRLKDGGTVKFQAILYSVSKVHRLSFEDADGYEDGIIVEFLGAEVLNTVR